MKFGTYLLRSIVGIVIIVQIYRFSSSMSSMINKMDKNIMRSFAYGYNIMMIAAIVILTIYVLQNIAGLFIELKYSRTVADDWTEESPENWKPMQILDKIQRVMGQIYRILFAIMFGFLGMACTLYANPGEGNIAFYIIPGIFILFALWIIIRAIKDIILIFRE